MADISFTSSKTGEALTEQQNIVAERTKAEQIKDNFYTALDALKPKWDNATGPQKNAALNAITNWDFAASTPTVARENALFAAIALAYIVMAYLAVRVGFKRSE